MAEQISVNIATVSNILRKLKQLEEEIRMASFDTEKTIYNAELDGWNDSHYRDFLESFMDTKTIINNAVNRIEEIHIPFVQRILRAAENFN